jgi:hypothetical protein
VKKMSIYLDPRVDRELARLAAEKGTSKAALIRAVLAEAAGVRPMPKGIGIIDGPGDLASNMDKYLEGFGED